MNINWPMIIVLFVLSLPGVWIAMPRLIGVLLAESSDALRKRFSRIAVIQTMIMVFMMSFAGTLLSTKTGFHDPILEGLLEGKVGVNALVSILLPTFFFALIGILVFCVLYYYLLPKTMLDEKNITIMRRLRAALGLDGLVLYGGVVEEVIARWGLTNLGAFFILLIAQQRSNLVMWLAIVVSAIMYGVGQVPAYIAAGCTSTRRFIYAIILLYVWQGLVFGYLLWNYGLISAILGHAIFHLVWAGYDKV